MWRNIECRPRSVSEDPETAVLAPYTIELEQASHDNPRTEARRRSRRARPMLNRDLRNLQSCSPAGDTELQRDPCAVRPEIEGLDRKPIEQFEPAIDVTDDEPE